MRHQTFSILQAALCLVFGAFLTGCSTATFTVKATRLQEQDPQRTTFRIESPPAPSTAVPAEPSPTRLPDYVRAALMHRGFRAAPPGSPAGMVVHIEFEQRPPRVESRTVTENLYQWQPEQTVLKTRETKLPTGLVLREAVPTRVAAHSEVVGSRKVNYLVKLFPKRLRIVARSAPDAASAEPGPPLWSVEVRNDEKVHDVDSCAALMVAAAMDYLGADFSGEKVVSLTRTEKRSQVILRADPNHA